MFTQEIKELIWFTHTNIDTRKINQQKKLGNGSNVDIDLTKYLQRFISSQLWMKNGYRSEYNSKYSVEDLQKILSIKINFHGKISPFSNAHEYEKVMELYHDISNVETWKIAESGISEAFQIAVISVKYKSNYEVIDDLTREEEKDFNIVFEKKMSTNNLDSAWELDVIKSIICEFLQFLTFNLHMTFLSKNYSFVSSDSEIYTGFTIVRDQKKSYYETNKINLLANYILFEENNSLEFMMDKTSYFWTKEIPSIHFFLNALKGSHHSIDNFSRTVFAFESFFDNQTSNDFMKVTVSILIGNNISEMRVIRDYLGKSFKMRNDYVHGAELPSLYSKVNQKTSEGLIIWELFYELKNIVIRMFLYFIHNDLYLKRQKHISQDLIFEYCSQSLNSTKKKK